MKAIEKSDNDTAYTLIEKNPAILTIYDQDGLNPIHRLVAENKIDVARLKELQQKGIEFLKLPCKNRGFTLLHIATTRLIGNQIGDLDGVKHLLALGADVNIPDIEGKTPLHYATQFGILPVLQLLCEHNANVEARDNQKKTPLHYAVLPEEVGGIYVSKDDIIRTLCRQHRASPNTQDNQGQTPLHLLFIEFVKLNNPADTIKKTFIKIIDTLLQVGADETISDNDGQSAAGLDKEIKLISLIIPLRQLTFENSIYRKRYMREEYEDMIFKHEKKKIIETHAPSLINTQLWKNIPKFTIITGRNGSGKSHLLQYTKFIAENEKKINFIYKSLNEDNQASSNAYLKLKKIFDSYYVQEWQSLFPNSRWVSTGEMLEASYVKGHFFRWPYSDRILHDSQTYLPPLPLLPELNTFLKKMLGEGEKNLQIFYHGVSTQQQADGKDFTFHSKMKLERIVKNVRTFIEYEELSSGEKLILDIFCWQFYAENVTDGEDVFEKISLLLLDEPDRHFDPELSKIFMNCLTFLSEAYNIQVMMTTHRTDTLAYVPEGSIFTIKRDKITNNASIEPTNRLHALFKLTPNLREITNFHIKVYTESFDDATFYEKIYHRLLKLDEAARKAYAAAPNGLTQRPRKIVSRRFQLSFYAVAMDYNGGGGGCAAVAKQVQIETLALKNIANRSGTKSLADKRIDYPFGILDADTTLVKSKSAKQKTRQLNSQDEILEKEIKPRQLIDLARHSLESYMYDPVLLCSLLTPEEIINWINNNTLKKFMLTCHDLITKPYDSGRQQEVDEAFHKYFYYFLEQFILKKPKDDAPKYLHKYGYLNSKRTIDTISPSVNVLTTLREDLNLLSNSKVSHIVDGLLQTQVKPIQIFTPQGTEGYTVQYPGFFIYMRGHNIEEFFQTTFFNWNCPQFDPDQPEFFNATLSMQFKKPKRPSFKELLIYKIRNDPEICLPIDLVDTIDTLSKKVVNHNNSIIKLKQTLSTSS
jgi:ankyrin repeat protein/energy-coupling factor transporter ATP-binding protein EcfA2